MSQEDKKIDSVHLSDTRFPLYMFCMDTKHDFVDFIRKQTKNDMPWMSDEDIQCIIERAQGFKSETKTERVAVMAVKDTKTNVLTVYNARINIIGKESGAHRIIECDVATDVDGHTNALCNAQLNSLRIQKHPEWVGERILPVFEVHTSTLPEALKALDDAKMREVFYTLFNIKDGVMDAAEKKAVVKGIAKKYGKTIAEVATDLGIK